MSHRYKMILTAVVSLLVAVGVVFLTWLLESARVCDVRGYFMLGEERIAYLTDVPCYKFLIDGVVLPLVFYPVAISLVVVILVFLREEIYRFWRRFAFVYILLALGLIALTPEAAGFLQPDRELVTWWTAGGFVVISLVLIVYKQWRLKRQEGR